MYKDFEGNFYSKQYHCRGLRGHWFRQRQNIVHDLVSRFYKEGAILDVGSGNCLWNLSHQETIGVDICFNMLRENRKKIKNFTAICADINKGLPFIKNKIFSMVILTEILEHFSDPRILINEIDRILKPGGVVIGSVPYAKLPGIWGCVFPAWCFYKGTIQQEYYYKHNCGHINKFNPQDIKALFKQFSLIYSRNFLFLTYFFVIRKCKT